MSSENQPQRKLKEPVESLRKRLLEDPNVQRSAKALQLTPEQFVEKVIDYAQNPDKKPVLTLMSEEDEAAVKAENPKFLTTQEINRELEKLVNGESKLDIPGEFADGFEKAQKKKVEM